MEIPGLNVKELSDDEIMRRISELQGKMLYAFNFSSSPEMLDQLQLIHEALCFEQSERIARKVWEENQKKAPKVIESDPIGGTKKADTQEATSKKSVRTTVGGLRRTKTPTSDL